MQLVKVSQPSLRQLGLHRGNRFEGASCLLPPLLFPFANVICCLALITNIMASIVNRPLAIFRKSDSPKPLHSRWGDTSISAPTDGSWNQYDNPHQPAPQRGIYGPGFVPDCPPTHRLPKPPSQRLPNEENRTSTSSTSVSRRNSLSLGALRPDRLSVRSTSRPKHARGENLAARDKQQPGPTKTGFAYKPIHHDYPSEINENVHAHRYRYIPTSGRYLEDIPGTSSRSRSTSSRGSSRTRHDLFSEPHESRGRSRESWVPASPRPGSYQGDDRRSLRSSLGSSSDGSGSQSSSGKQPKRSASPFVTTDRKRSSFAKPMTLAMVPDPDELYE